MPHPVPRRRAAALVALALTTATLSACARVAPEGAVPPEPAPTAAPTPTPSPTPEPVPRRLSVTVSGDLLWHRGLLADGVEAGRKVDRAYDFVPLFEHVRPLIEDADVSICHLEVPVAPEGVTPAGYPVFAAPPETVEAAARVGFDYCTFASNHTFDQGVRGIAATLDKLDAEGIVHTGAYRDEATAGIPGVLTTASGVKLAVVAGSYHSNLRVPAGREWALDRLDADAMIVRGRAARAAGADVVLAAMHAGTEHQHKPNAEQVRVATALAESGVFDVVYGHHAHVPQPWDRINDTWVVYGGGNLVAQMKVATPRAWEQYLGRITLEEQDGRWRAVAAEYVPLMMTLGRPGAPARVLDVNKALAEGRGDAERLRVAREQVANAVGMLGAQVAEVR